MFVCLSFMNYYTFHPIAIKLWEVVEYTPGVVPAEFLFLFHKWGAPSGSDEIFLYVKIKVGWVRFDTVHTSAMKFWGADEKASAKKKQQKTKKQ